MKLLFLAAAAAIPGLGAGCSELASLKLPETAILSAEIHAIGVPLEIGGASMGSLPGFCHVSGSIRPSPDSDIRFEVWMPAKWNGKFQGIGNGGFAGSIDFAALADAVRHGYAAAATDTGHQMAGRDARWALHHPEKIADFGYRAIHETAVAAKAVIEAFYGDAPRHSYFNSCSNGGRQGLMEAQRYPADYDGIVAGAPANDWTGLQSAGAQIAKAMAADPAAYIPAAKLPAIEAAALASCDEADGVKDGVIEDPRQCHFDPAALLCEGQETNACLTEVQLAVVRTIYGGLRDSDRRQIFPGFSPGGEAEQGGWGSWVSGTGPGLGGLANFATQFFRNMVYDDERWQVQSFDSGRDPQFAVAKASAALNATNADLSAFRSRGGRLILFHGWADAAIPPLNTVVYYESVVAKMGADETKTFARLYMVPGMEHCSGGAGPNDFGQSKVAHTDAAHDIDAALEAWVEGGHAPEEIIAAKLDAGVLQRTRPLCPYPQVARWKGTGSTDHAANFVCGAP